VIVADASAAPEILLRTSKARVLDDLLLSSGAALHAPQLIDVEVTQALRRLVLSGDLDELRAAQAIDDLRGIRIERHAHGDFVRRAWQLRSATTACDAMYVALAEALEAPLVTCDVKLSRARGHGAVIRAV
jgi:predicted nucleic acid-binding protein